MTLALVFSCTEKPKVNIPVITVSGDFEVVEEHDLDTETIVSVFRYVSLRDAATDSTVAIIKICRTVKEEKEGAY